MGPRSCLLLLLLLVFLLVSTKPVSAVCGDLPANKCAPVSNTNCAGCNNNPQKIPNPFNCYSYYQCNAAALLHNVPFNCPPGQKFDPDTNTLDCVAVAGVPCKPACPAGGGGQCLYTCPGNPNGKLADPYDCNVFYECSGGNIGDEGPAQLCPPSTPFFDGNTCQKDEFLCCHCQPYCFAGDANSVVADPKDCRKYHLCGANQGLPVLSGECNPNEYFNSHLQTCSSSTPCVTDCKNVVGHDRCIDPFTCLEKGYFAKCPYKCVPEYFHCTEVSDTYAVPDSCPDGLVFHPDNLVCIQNSTCPYH